MKRFWAFLLTLCMLFTQQNMVVLAAELGDVLAQEPVVEENETTGTFGDNNGFTWTYDAATKTITVTGEDTGLNAVGERNYLYNSPFVDLDLEIEKVIFENCVFKGSLRGLFYNVETIKEIEFINCNTSAVTDMSVMFYYCKAITSIDLSGFDTSNVTDMSDMFSYCDKLVSLDVSGFNTSKVTNMADMFHGCKSLTTLDVSKFDTSNVTNLSGMFETCVNLESLDVSGFVTSKVTNFDSMFYQCKKLAKIDVSKFDTSNATDMGWMFKECNSLTSVDVSKFETSKVTDMSDMFSSCSSLAQLDVKNFKTTNVEYMDRMFNDCKLITSLDVSSFDTSKVRSMEKMFNGCYALTSLDLRNFNTSNVEWMEYMFNNCEALTSLNVSSFDTSKVESFRWMFYGCRSLPELDLSNFDIMSGANVISMLTDCNSVDILKSPRTIGDGVNLEAPGINGKETTYCDSERNFSDYITKTNHTYYKVYTIEWYPGATENNPKNPEWFICTDGVIIPKDPGKLENYVFAGWYTENTYKTQVKEIDTAKTKETVRLFAKWIPAAPAKPHKIVNVVSGVHVYWKPVGTFTKYGVWRSETGKNGTYKWIANPSATHFTDTKVESGKTYYYKITAVQNNYLGDTHGVMSEPIGITYVGTPDITTRNNKAAGIELGWDKIKGATGYAIYRKPYGSDTWKRIATITDPTQLTYVDTAVKNNNGSIYKYTVRALAGTNKNTLSGCRNNGRTMTRLTSRTISSAKVGANNSIITKWDTSKMVSGYEIRFMDGSKVTAVQKINSYKTGSGTYRGFTKGKTYKVQVRSYKITNVGTFYSAWSAPKNVTIK